MFANEANNRKPTEPADTIFCNYSTIYKPYLLTKTNVYEKIYFFLVTGRCFCDSNSAGGDRYQLGSAQ